MLKDQAVDALREKAINQYMHLLSRLKKGYKDDYTDLMNLICFINLPIKIDKYDFIKQYLINYGENNLHVSKGCGCTNM